MEPTSEGRPDTAATSAGAWLRNARQQRGLHIAALAVMLKVPQAKLEALEADRHDLLPDATFARALATAMCRALKVDPAPVLALLPRSSDQGLDVRPGLNQPFRERGTGSVIDGRALALLGNPVVWGALLLLVAAAAVYWVPAGWIGSGAPEPAASAVAFPASAAGVVASAPEEFVAAPAAVPEASAPAAASVPPPVTTSAASAAAPAAADGLRVTATADTWVEVSDARGQILLSRVLPAGEQQDFSGAPPYRLRIGNVSGTRIAWRGAAVDLAAWSKDNVARLELK